MDIELAPRLLRTSLLCCVAVLAIPSLAAAQTPSPEDIASARALGTDGVRLADSGDCASAIPKLEAAERLYHAPSTLEHLGECQVNVGRLVAGTESLNRVVRENLPPGAPPAFVAAQHRAAQILASAKPRIGKLRIHVEGAPIDKISVTVDGANVPSALFDAERATDPGTHEVKAVATGYRAAIASVQLPAGADSTVSLKLEPDPNAGATPTEASAPAGEPRALATASPAPPAPAPVSGSSGSKRIPAFIALGVGGAGVAVGSVFGILALGSKSALDNACLDKQMCPASSQSDIDALSSRATISNVGFVVGIVGLAVGIVLLVTTHGEESQPATASLSSSRVRMSPWLGARTAGLEGTFE